jgi:hypothetical protein
VSCSDRSFGGSGLSALQLIDLISPEHGRTSCSDDNNFNGFGGRTAPRCNRCALLDAAEGAWPEWGSISIYMNIPTVETLRTEQAEGDSPMRRLR